MPRITKKKKVELVEALDKSDDDDDGDLLQTNTYLQPSQRSPDSSMGTPSTVSIELTALARSKETFEERGKEQNSWKQSNATFSL
jgi:hypothetical protein